MKRNHWNGNARKILNAIILAKNPTFSYWMLWGTSFDVICWLKRREILTEIFDNGIEWTWVPLWKWEVDVAIFLSDNWRFLHWEIEKRGWHLILLLYYLTGSRTILFTRTSNEWSKERIHWDLPDDVYILNWRIERMEESNLQTTLWTCLSVRDVVSVGNFANWFYHYIISDLLCWPASYPWASYYHLLFVAVKPSRASALHCGSGLKPERMSFGVVTHLTLCWNECVHWGRGQTVGRRDPIYSIWEVLWP